MHFWMITTSATSKIWKQASNQVLVKDNSWNITLVNPIAKTSTSLLIRDHGPCWSLELRTFRPKLKGLKDYLQKWPHKVKNFANENLNHGPQYFSSLGATDQAPHTLHLKRFLLYRGGGHVQRWKGFGFVFLSLT
jgi:hypothetical protein